MYAPRDSSTVPFAHGLWKLPLPLPCKEQLMEVFSDFPRHTKRLAALMKPVMERLGSALAPWVDRAEPLIRQWEATLQDQDLAQFLQTHMLIQTDYPWTAPPLPSSFSCQISPLAWWMKKED